MTWSEYLTEDEKKILRQPFEQGYSRIAGTLNHVRLIDLEGDNVSVDIKENGEDMRARTCFDDATGQPVVIALTFEQRVRTSRTLLHEVSHFYCGHAWAAHHAKCPGVYCEAAAVVPLLRYQLLHPEDLKHSAYVAGWFSGSHSEAAGLALDYHKLYPQYSIHQLMWSLICVGVKEAEEADTVRELPRPGAWPIA